jgi:AmpE protein
MSTTLIAVVVALLLGHVAQPLAISVRHYGWWGNWLRWLGGRFGEGGLWHGRYGIVIALLPPVIAIALFQLALDEPILGLAGLLLGVAVLFYAWGPRDLDLDVDAIAAAQDPAARRDAAARLWPHDQSPTLDGPGLVDAVFRNSLRRWFGVLFWFLPLGACGALLYRLVALAAEGDETHLLPGENAAGARVLLTLLDWPVTQLMTLSMALVGNFDAVLGAWKDGGGASLRLDTGFLGAAARASVRSEIADEAQDYAESGVSTASAIATSLGELPELRDAMSLVWRILLLWLAVMALFVIAGWVA